MSKFICLVVCVAVSLNNVSAFGTQAFLKGNAHFISECVQEIGVSEAEIKAVQEGGLGDINPCFLGCIFRKNGILDSNGMYDVEKTNVQLNAYVKGAEDIAELEKVTQACTSVNNHAVSGDAFCERAKLLQGCGIKLDVDEKIPDEK